MLTCAATALRASEILALRWADILWAEGKIRVSKRWAKGKDGETKTEAPTDMFRCIRSWREHLRDMARQTPHAMPSDFVFPSLKGAGKIPLYASTFVADYLRPAAIKAGVRIEKANGSAFTTCDTA